MLLDDVFVLPWSPPYNPPAHLFEAWQSRAGALRQQLAPAQVFQISNVAEYLYAVRGQNSFELLKDFPRPMPPFKLLWAEWKFPPIECVGKGFKSFWLRDHLAGGMGCAIFTETASAGWKEKVDASWVMQVHPFLRSYGKNDIACLPQVCYLLGEDFNIVSATPGGTNHVYVTFPKAVPEEDYTVEDGIVYEVIRMMDVPLLAMSLLNRRNVGLRTIPTPRALIRANLRRGKHVTESHHVIEIQPLLQHLKRETGDPGYSRKAASIVRGHFKDYSERGLFGKYKGMFWWDQRINSPTVNEYRLKKSGAELDEGWENTRRSG